MPTHHTRREDRPTVVDDRRFVEVPLEDTTRGPRVRARAVPELSGRGTGVRRSLCMLAVGALGGVVLVETLSRPGQPSSSGPAATAASTTASLDCRQHLGGCTTEEYRSWPRAGGFADNTPSNILLCQMDAAGCSTEDHRAITPVEAACVGRPADRSTNVQGARP